MPVWKKKASTVVGRKDRRWRRGREEKVENRTGGKKKKDGVESGEGMGRKQDRAGKKIVGQYKQGWDFLLCSPACVTLY